MHAHTCLGVALIWPSSASDHAAQVSFLPLDISEEDSIQDVLSQIDAAIQFGEDADVKVQEFDMPADDM